MKTNGLMIGDIILIDTLSERGYLPITVQEVAKECILVDLGEGLEEADDSALKPMPLTTEILEKNGFQRQEEERGFSEPYIVYVNDDYRYPIKIYPKGLMDRAHHLYIGYDDDEPRLSLYINYVHQLQHALRLVGLSEIADNIKI